MSVNFKISRYAFSTISKFVCLYYETEFICLFAGLQKIESLPEV